MQYNIDVFYNLKNIYKNQYGGSQSIDLEQQSNDYIINKLKEFTESNKVDDIIEYFNSDLSRLNTYSVDQANSIVGILLYEEGLEPKNKIKIFEYLIDLNKIELFKETNNQYNKHPISVFIKNYLLLPYSDEKIEKYINILKQLLDMDDNLQNLIDPFHEYKYFDCLYHSILLINFINANNPEKTNLFLQLISQEILKDCHNKFIKSIKNIDDFYNLFTYSSNFYFDKFVTIFDFIWKTSQITIDFLLDIFTILFNHVKSIISEDDEHAALVCLNKLYEYLISADNSKNNRDTFLSSNKDGTTFLHIMFTKLSINPLNQKFINFYENYSDFYIRFIDLFHNTIILSKNNKFVGTTILHNALYYKCPIHIIDFLLHKAPDLISIPDSKRKYPIFYATEVPSNIEIFSVIMHMTPKEHFHIESENKKIPLEFIMKNLNIINYTKEMVIPFIKENNHLPLINTIEKYTIIDTMGLYNTTMKFKNKTLKELIAYFWNKMERDHIITTASRKFKVLFEAINPTPLLEGPVIHRMELDKTNIIEEYLYFLTRDPYNLNSIISQFKIRDEIGIDAGGVEKTVWKYIMDTMTRNYCTEYEDTLYFKSNLTRNQYLSIGNIIGRGYRYGPKISHGDIYYGGYQTHSSIPIINTKMAYIIKVGLFQDIPEETIENFIKAELKPEFPVVYERFISILISYIMYCNPDGNLITHEGKTMTEIINNFVDNCAVIISIEDNEYYIDAFKNLILNDTKTDVDPLFNNFIKEITDYIGPKKMDHSIITIKINKLFDTLGLTDKLNSKVYNKMIDGYIYAKSEPIKALLTSFFENKHIIIEGINQIIYGFFDVDIRRIMKVNLNPLPITLKGLKKRLLFKQSEGLNTWNDTYPNMSQSKLKIMELIANRTLNQLHTMNALPKFVTYFSGIPLILSYDQTYTFLSYTGDRLFAHVCFNKLDFPAALITRDRIDDAVDLLVSDIMKDDNTFTDA